jgi:hypothetical protein
MALKDWKDLKPEEKTPRGQYELIKKELDKQEKSKSKKSVVEIKDEPQTTDKK